MLLASYLELNFPFSLQLARLLLHLKIWNGSTFSPCYLVNALELLAFFSRLSFIVFSLSQERNSEGPLVIVVA